ncbi:MAG TPA: hypothetical protein VFA77_16835 [Candidatus Eisenbacteria bacterium]|nr:hypothetical protein [Candidatus Eisenbacteria bacterium]
MNLRSLSHLMIAAATVLFGFTSPAMAGPPLICHVIQIGDAKSLPWVDLNYQKQSGGYDLKNLTPDTLAILQSDAPVLVRMETLRRATIYARQDPQVAKELLTRLRARAADSDLAGRTDPLAWFDVGYLAAAYNEWFETGTKNPANGLDGYAWVEKALRLRGPDPQMEFAAALITIMVPKREHTQYVKKAWAGSKGDALLAQNMAANFPR